MNLIAFHRFLIVAGILFCLGFAVWEARRWSAGGGNGPLALAILFFAFAVALTLYLRRLRRILGYDRGESDRQP